MNESEATLSNWSPRRGFMLATGPNVKKNAEFLANLGANILRFPIYFSSTGGNTPLEDWLLRIEEVLTITEPRNIVLVIDIHHPEVQDPDPKKTWAISNDDEFVRNWSIIAQRFSGRQFVWYDLLNEPKSVTAMGTPWPDIALRAAQAIRQYDQKHKIVYAALGSTTRRAPNYKPLPGITNQVIQFHFWNWPKVQLDFEHPVTYPSGKYTKERLTQLLEEVRDVGQRYNLPVYIGECGIYQGHNNAPDFLRDFTDICSQLGIHLTIHAFREAIVWNYEFNISAWSVLYKWLKTNADSPPQSLSSFSLQTGTAMPETDDSFEFALSDWDGDNQPDLFIVKKRNTTSHSTEIHILSGASNFQQFNYHTGTALSETDDSFTFALADWDGNGKPDLVAIKKRNTGSQSTEVHILSAASHFQQFVFQSGTALPETDDSVEFALADWDGNGKPDLFVIKKRNTTSQSTEIHILSGASNFQEFIYHTGTALSETDDSFTFALADWDGNGKPDLVAIKKRNTGSQSTEVHILSAASHFQQFIFQSGTALPEADDSFEFELADWDGNGKPDLFVIKKRNTGSHSTEVHILH